ncbi:uncharacterized protein LOC135220514 [Macrobrachium nipponense]|uniref:uncharacterized protein LOC135220514 n=1 Tax=Macrobrachium nipponense TaxID=159736 RepID=UPI0030C7E460
MSSVAPVTNARVISTPCPSGGVTKAWARKIPSKQLLLRALEVIGWILGHSPGSFRFRNEKTVFTYRTFHTAYCVLLTCIVTAVQVYYIASPNTAPVKLDTATNVAAVTPHYMDMFFYYLLAAFNLYHAPNIKTVFDDIYRMGRTTKPPSLLKQFLTLSVWVVYSGITIARTIVLSVQLFAVEKSTFNFGDFIVPFTSTYIKIYITWALDVYILICLSLYERMIQLRALMTDVLTPQREGYWSQLDLHVIEGVMDQHKNFSLQVTRFFETMSSALFVLVASYFINTAFGLQTFLTNITLIEGFFKPMALVEICFLLFHFLLISSACYVTSSISDEWCGVGQEVTGVPLCRVSDRIRVQLLTFIQRLPHQAPVVTGAGFFVISKSMLLTMMNFIATYIIFMVQFSHV